MRAVAHRDHVVRGVAVVVRGRRQLDRVVELLLRQIPILRVDELQAENRVEVQEHMERVFREIGEAVVFLDVDRRVIGGVGGRAHIERRGERREALVEARAPAAVGIVDIAHRHELDRVGGHARLLQVAHHQRGDHRALGFAVDRHGVAAAAVLGDVDVQHEPALRDRRVDRQALNAGEDRGGALRCEDGFRVGARQNPLNEQVVGVLDVRPVELRDGDSATSHGQPGQMVRGVDDSGLVGGEPQRHRQGPRCSRGHRRHSDQSGAGQGDAGGQVGPDRGGHDDS